MSREIFGVTLYTIPEAATSLRVSRATLYSRIGKGEFQPVKVGGRTFIRRDDLEAVVTGRRGPLAPAKAPEATEVPEPARVLRIVS